MSHLGDSGANRLKTAWMSEKKHCSTLGILQLHEEPVSVKVPYVTQAAMSDPSDQVQR